MKPQILPQEILNNSVIVHRFLFSKKNQIIYGLLLFFIFSTLAALPFIYIDVYSSARGIVEPEKERISLQPLNSGRVVYSKIENHVAVKKGDTLLILESQQIEEKEQLLIQKITEKKEMLQDLRGLLKPSQTPITTPKYISAKTLFDQQLIDLKIKLDKAAQDLKRNTALYEKQIIATIEMEKFQFEFELAQNNLSEFKKRSFAQWENEHTQEKNRLAELQSQLKQLEESQAEYMLLAPYEGTLLNVKGIQPNTYVQAGQPLAEISPSTNLIVNCYVSPTDIGFLKLDTPAKFQIDAYNYNQWGWARGKIKTIGSDIELLNGKPVFQIQCTLNEKELFLKNGVAGTIKKGMTVRAQFFKTKRSLWQLLFDKVDDWLNPSRQKPLTT